VRDADSRVYSIVQWAISSMKAVQAFQGRGGIRPLHGREPDQPRRHAELYNRQPFYSGLVNTLIAAGTALVIYVGARSVLSGTPSVGQR